MTKKLFLCFLLLYPFIGSSQVDEKVDTLISNLYSKASEQFKNNQNALAVPYYLEIDSIAQKHNILNEHVVKAVSDRSEISRLTFTHDGVENAKTLQLEALQMAKKLGSKEVLGLVFLRLSDLYMMVGEPDSSKTYTDKAFTYFQKTDNPVKLARTYLLYMNYYLDAEQYDSVEAKLKEGITYLKTKDNPKELATLLFFLGNYWQKYRSQCDKAVPLFEESKLVYEQMGDTISTYYMYILEGLGICYGELQQYQNAYKSYQLAYHSRRELEKKRNNELSRNLETKYSAEKKQREIDLLNAENKLAQEQTENQRILFIIILAAVLLLALFLFMLYRNRQKTTNKLKELDAVKSNFFANISHEFRTPLTLIKGPVQKQLSESDLTDKEREHLLMIDRNTDRLLSLVDQLLDLSKLESGNLTLHVEKASFASFARIITAPFQYLAEQKHIEFTTDIAEDTESYFDKDIAEKVIVNLLSNAIKYTAIGGDIHYSQRVDTKEVTIQVKNSGEPIPKQEQEKVFDRFYQMSTAREGVGIGLSLVQELTLLHKGLIRLRQDEQDYTCFEVKFPIAKAAYIEEELVVQNGSENLTSPQALTMRSSQLVDSLKDNLSTDKPIMLIVDDNPDLRQLISDIFSSNYSILLAENGEIGISKAFKHVPDIIISDVMMPVIDGVELSQTLRADERTSHIPIILLTAKAGEENELKGLETGADEYMVKPFNNDILKVRVEKLIALREQLRARYSQEVVLRPKDIAITSTDEKFLERVQHIMDTHLTKSNFTAEFFSKEIGMSRMQLHRKIKALIGLSTSEFIKSQRLKMAIKLLDTSDINISEVGYSVGFNDPSYFAKCFKETYGQTPTQYVSTANTES